MAISKNVGSTKRYGARYGRTVRHIAGKIENMQRKAHKCPYCRQEKAKRVSAGIWNCKNCGSTFTGKAYTVSPAQKKKTVSAEE